MKIVLIVVTSIDGITYQKEKPLESHHEWTSKEDVEFFTSMRDKASLILMGSKTYEGAKSQVVHSDQKLRIVFTRNPEKYEKEKIPNILEFTNKSPKEKLQELESKGYTEALLMGGANLNADFFKENLVSELWMTVEPIILGDGVGITEKINNYPMKLISMEKLNERGTLLLKYKAY